MARILITVQSLHHGGMEKIAAELARGLHGRGHEVCVIGVHDPGGAYTQRLVDAGVEVHTGLARHRRSVLLAILRIRQICRRRRFHFAIAAMGGAMYAPYATVIACRSLRIPCVRWLHTMPGEHPLSAFSTLIQRIMTKAGNHVVALTETHARSLKENWGIPASQITVIWNGQPLPPRVTPERAVLIRKELGIGLDCFVIGMVAVFRSVKRHEILIQAMKQVMASVPHAHLLFVGDGDTRREMETLVARLGLESHVTFLGARTDALRLYAAMDVHVLCSYPQETFPLSITEAMAAGVVPIATRVGGIPELVANGKTGILVEPESPAALADAIVDLAKNAPMLQRMSEAAHQFAMSHFSLDAILDAFTKLMESSIASEKQAHSRQAGVSS